MGTGRKVGRTHLFIDLPDLMLSSVLERHDGDTVFVVGSKLASIYIFWESSTMEDW